MLWWVNISKFQQILYCIHLSLSLYILPIDINKFTLFICLSRGSNCIVYLGNCSPQFLMLTKESIISTWSLTSVFIQAMFLFVCFSAEEAVNSNFPNFYVGDVPILGHRCGTEKWTASGFRRRKKEKSSLSTVTIKQYSKISLQSWSNVNNFETNPNRCLIHVMTTYVLL